MTQSPRDPSALAPRYEERAAPNAGISKRLTWLFAVACGVSGANIYYAQPLLGTLAHEFKVGTGTAGLIVTSSQVGYALALAFLIPLGDIVARRTMVLSMASICMLALLAAAGSVNIGMLIGLSLIIGITATVAQVLVPFAASLAADSERGRVIGQVMSGLLAGLLLARAVSGFIADAAGWRSVFVTAAGIELVLIVVLSRALPRERERPSMSYPDLLRSIGRFMRTEPLLMWRTMLGAAGLACFMTMWTTLAFLLRGSPYHYSDSAIGLFGLLGAGSVVAANFTGRISDRGYARQASFGFAVLILLSFGFLAWGRHELAALLAGILLLDLGVQGLQVTSQGIIYAIAPEARSRINAVFMTGYLIGGSLGSAAASLAYEVFGWSGVCVLGSCIAAFMVVVTIMKGPSASRTRCLPGPHPVTSPAN